jgi:thymidylate kinase
MQFFSIEGAIDFTRRKRIASQISSDLALCGLKVQYISVIELLNNPSSDCFFNSFLTIQSKLEDSFNEKNKDVIITDGSILSFLVWGQKVNVPSDILSYLIEHAINPDITFFIDYPNSVNKVIRYKFLKLLLDYHFPVKMYSVDDFSYNDIINQIKEDCLCLLNNRNGKTLLDPVLQLCSSW